MEPSPPARTASALVFATELLDAERGTPDSVASTIAGRPSGRLSGSGVRLPPLGAYEPIDELGRGGAGVVYRARGKDGREVAVKLIKAGTGSGESLARFERERRLLSQLGESSGFVPLIDSGESPAGPFFVMPLLTGGTLRDKLKRGPLEVSEALALGRDLARTVSLAHERGIVHRDLKPENVLFDDNGKAFVADLGLAKHFRHDSPGASMSVALSRTGELRGTVGYMAPEQAREAKRVGPPADVFSLGAIIYECLSGRPAFDAETLVEVVKKLESGLFEPLSKERPDAPRWLQAIVHRALALDADARYADAGVLFEALENEGGERKAQRTAAPVAALLAVTLGMLFILAAVGVVALVKSKAGATPPPMGSDAPAPPNKPTPPPPPPPPPPEPRFPDACRGFLRTSRTRLERFVGGFAWKHGGPVTVTAFAPDGKSVITGGLDSRLRVWDLATGEEKWTLTGKAPPTALALTPDGRHAVSGSADGVVAFWDLGTGQLVKAETVHEGIQVDEVVVSPDGRSAWSIGAQFVKHWDLTRFEALTGLELQGEVELVDSTFSADGRWCLTSVTNGDLVLLRLVENGAVESFRATEKVVSVALSAEGGRALVGTDEGQVLVYDMGAKKKLGAFKVGGKEAVNDVSFSAGGTTAVACVGRNAVVIDLASQSVVRTIPAVSRGLAISAALSPDGQRLLTGGEDHVARVFDLTTGRVMGTVPGYEGMVRGLSIDKGGTRAFAAGDDWRPALFDLDTGKRLRTFEGHADALWDLDLTDDATRLVSASLDTTVRLWDTSVSSAVSTLKHKAPATAAALSSDGKRIASGTDDGVVHVWDVATGREVQTLEKHDDGVTSLAFCGDGTIASAGKDGTVRLWDLTRGVAAHVLRDHKEPVVRLAEAGRGRIVTGGDDHAIRLWDTATGKLVRTLSGEHPIYSLDVSPDGKVAVAGYADGHVWFWDLESGAEIDRVSLATSGDLPTSVAFVRDGSRRVVVGTARGVLLRFVLER